MTTSPGIYTAYNDRAVTGAVTVNGHTMTTPFFGTGIADLLEETAEVINSITGTDPSGNEALVICWCRVCCPPFVAHELSETFAACPMR